MLQGGPILGHHPPGAAAAGDVEDAVEDLAPRHGAGPPAGLGLGQPPLELLPLVAGQVGGGALGVGPDLFGFLAEF